MQFVRILVSALVPALAVAISAGCGQKGPLFIPTDAAARQRATLPETLIRPTGRPASAQPRASAPVEPIEAPPQPLVPVDSPL